WLGIEEGDGIALDLPEFPLPVPEYLRDRAESTWMRRVIDKRGLYFRNILPRRLPRELKEDVARISADYFRRHGTDLDGSIVQERSDFLPMEQIEALREIVPPPVPPPPPTKAPLAAEWFRNSYLPYRLWAIDRDDAPIQEICRDRGTAFARWYL